MIYQTGCGLWPKPDRIMTLPIIQVWTMLKMNLSYHDQLDQVRSMKRTRKDNDLTNRIGMIYTEKENWVVVTPWTRCDLWRKPNKTMMWRFACLVYAKNDTELSRPIEPGAIYEEKRQDNEEINCTGAIYGKKWKCTILIDRTKWGLSWKPDTTTTWATLQV